METEKLAQINKKLNDFRENFSYPTAYLYDYFTRLKNEVDLSAENLMSTVNEADSVNNSRCELIARVDSFYNECLARCPHEVLTNNDLSKCISNELEAIEIKLSELDDNSDLFNDSTMEDELIGMLANDTIDSLNKSLNVLKQKNSSDKLLEIESKIDGLDDIFKKFLFNNQTMIFFDRNERDKYLTSDFLFLRTNCENITIKDSIYSQNKWEANCYCGLCPRPVVQNVQNPQQIYQYVPVHEYYVDGYEGEYDVYNHMIDDYDMYEMMFGYDEYGYEEESNSDEDDEEEDDNDEEMDESNSQSSDVIVVEEVKPEDLFFGVLFKFNDYMQSKDSFL